MVIVIKIIIKLLLRKTFTKMQTPPRTPSPFRLPPVCPGAPVKNGTNPDNVPIGNSVRQCLFPKDDGDDDGYETPPPTIRTEPPKLVRKKQR